VGEIRWTQLVDATSQFNVHFCFSGGAVSLQDFWGCRAPTFQETDGKAADEELNSSLCSNSRLDPLSSLSCFIEVVVLPMMKVLDSRLPDMHCSSLSQQRTPSCVGYKLLIQKTPWTSQILLLYFSWWYECAVSQLEVMLTSKTCGGLSWQ
jgi:hypothetical protein